MQKIMFPILMFLVFSCTQKAVQRIEYANIEKHIKELSDDKYMGRAPMSASEDGVVNYIAGQMKEIGLEPANNGSYFQEVPMMAVTSEISNTLDIQTPKSLMKLEKLTDYVTFSQKVAELKELKNSEIIFAGFGITAPEYGRDDFQGMDLKGKTILVFVNDPGYGTTGDYFKGNTMTYYGRWTYKFEEAARKGAEACLIVHETGPAGYPWGVVRNNGEGANYYLQPEDGYKDRCAFEGWISKSMAEKLFADCGLSFDEAKQLAISKDFKPFSLKSYASASMKSQFVMGKSKNVCGLVRGTERPDEVVVYTAHWDHLGVGTKIEGDSIYNGASDNASAVAWLLEMARLMKQNPPKRSVLFMSVTAEESGLLGAEYYVQNPFFLMNKTVACINTDVILFLGKFKDVTMTGFGQTELDKWVEAEAKKQGRYVVADTNPENGMYFRSDQFPFVKAGVPAIFAKGYTDAEKYGKEETAKLISKYWQETYHKPNDEYVAERDNLEGLVQDAELMLNVGRNLANSDQFPGWNEGSEFKAIREKSMK